MSVVITINLYSLKKTHVIERTKENSQILCGLKMDYIISIQEMLFIINHIYMRAGCFNYDMISGNQFTIPKKSQTQLTNPSNRIK